MLIMTGTSFDRFETNDESGDEKDPKICDITNESCGVF